MRFNALIPELAVTDCAASLGFYRDILGFSVAHARLEEGFALLTLGEAQLMVDQIGSGRTWETAPMQRPLGRGINLQIRVTAIDPLVMALECAGVPLFLAVEEKWYRHGDRRLGSRQFAVQDPDGYLLRFSEDLGLR
ncbi:MAG: bleomycin resistance protein [Devosia sp.]